MRIASGLSLLCLALCVACTGTQPIVTQPTPEPANAAVETPRPATAERAAVGTISPGPSRFDAGTPEQDGGPVNPLAVSAPSSAAVPGAPVPLPLGVPADAQRIVLVFSASQAGQLVPCGCSPGQKGGEPRLGGQLAAWRAEGAPLLYVDAGDLLFPQPNIPQGPAREQAELKARTLAQCSKLLQPAARVVGARDLAAGPQFVGATAQGVPLLDAGIVAPGTQETLLAEAGGVRVGFFAAGLGKDSAKLATARAQALRNQGARVVVALLHPTEDHALSGAQALLPALREAGVDLAVLGHRDDPAVDPSRVEQGSPALLAPQGHGQELLRVDLILRRDLPARAPVVLSRGAEGRTEELATLDDRIANFQARLGSASAELKPQLEQKIAELQKRRAETASAVEKLPAGAIVAVARMVDMGPEVPDAPELVRAVAAYDAEVARLNLEAAKSLPATCPKPARNEAAYIGVSGDAKRGTPGCADCHATETTFWARERHAHAYETLVSVGKQYSLDCIRCHVTGWQQPGGVCRIDRTPAGGDGVKARFDADTPASVAHRTALLAGVGRQDVQCEMCHGPGSLHARSPEKHALAAKVGPEVCTRCHEAENSPNFDYAKYLPWVIGPGHGEPLAKGQEPRSRGELDTGHLNGPNPGLRTHGAGMK